MANDQQTTSNKPTTGFQMRLDYRMIITVLLIIIAVMLAIWQPWSSSGQKEDRIVKVTGQTTILAEPDEYVFSPTYEFKNADKQVAIDELSKKSDEVVGKIKELGVPDTKIKTNADGNDYQFYYREDTSEPVYTLRLTITANSRDQAQKVQDYLVTTAPLGAIAPYANFSEAKRKELESKARDEAIKDARAKAEESAKNLDFKLGKVKSVDDGGGLGGIPYATGLEKAVDSRSLAVPSLGVQPGENELPYSVTVIYYVR